MSGTERFKFGVNNHPQSGWLEFSWCGNCRWQKRQKHVCASMLNLQSHPVWARIKPFNPIE
jgi:hypothetical protein